MPVTTAPISAFILGKHQFGNRKMVVLPAGVQYDFDTDTVQYENAYTKFPYGDV